ncbi:MAG: hypothetical protein DCF22_25745 [Leptolyngbya sp.]|nr:MAG: hypothetical protein DCF22_25745 [Leptolyngbya sp.]
MREWKVKGAIAASLLLMESWTGIALALPPAVDTPEEVLRTEIILDARSPIDGRPMTPAAYAELQNQLNAPIEPPVELSRKLVNTVKLLKLRKFIKKYLPFFPLN